MTLLLNLSKKQLLCNLYGYYDYPLQQAFLSRQLGTLQYTLLLLVSVSVYFKQHLKLHPVLPLRHLSLSYSLPGDAVPVDGVMISDGEAGFDEALLTTE